MKVDFTGSDRDPTVKNNVKIPYGEAKRKSHTARWVLVLLVLLSPVIYLGGKIIYEQAVPCSVGAVLIEKIVVNAAYPGVVEEIHYREGDVIQVDDTLLRLKDDPAAGSASSTPARAYEKNRLATGRYSAFS